MTWHSDLPHLSPGMWAALIALNVVQVGLMVWALVRLIRTDKSRLTLPLPAWLLIVLLVNGLGPIAFLAVGRKPAAVPDPAPRPHGESASRHAIDTLYGGGDD